MLALFPIFISTVLATDYVKWFNVNKTEFAQSTVKPDATGLTTLWKNESNAQFQYDKLIGDPKKAPLVTVFLINKDAKLNFSLQTGFDTISQQCSCYWLDIKDLEGKFLKNGLITSSKYQIQFKGGDMDSLSGFFRLQLTSETSSPAPAASSTKVVTSTPVSTVTKASATVSSSTTQTSTSGSTSGTGDSGSSRTVPKSDDKGTNSIKDEVPLKNSAAHAVAGFGLVMGAAVLI